MNWGYFKSYETTNFEMRYHGRGYMDTKRNFIGI